LWSIHAYANPSLDTVMLLITAIGAPLPMIGLVIVLLGFLLWLRRYAAMFFATVAVGGRRCSMCWRKRSSSGTAPHSGRS
jgi:hypothetical protein